jgi:hypothetical protein
MGFVTGASLEAIRGGGIGRGVHVMRGNENIGGIVSERFLSESVRPARQVSQGHYDTKVASSTQTRSEHDPY